jgi:hypothetical protein
MSRVFLLAVSRTPCLPQANCKKNSVNADNHLKFVNKTFQSQVYIIMDSQPCYSLDTQLAKSYFRHCNYLVLMTLCRIDIFGFAWFGYFQLSCFDRFKVSASTTSRRAGGLSFRPQAEKAKARQCFKRCGWNRVRSTRFENNQSKRYRYLK